MLPDQKKKALAALKRLNGLSKKVEDQIENAEYCTEILRNVLAMKGHIEHIQSQILHNHLHTCAQKKLISSDKDEFIDELIQVIGLSKR